MSLKNISFTIDKNKLNKEEENFFLNVYYELSKKIYGKDYYDAYLEVTENKKALNSKCNIYEISHNYQNIITILNSLNKENYYLLKIYDKKKLIGMGRIILLKKSFVLKELALKEKKNYKALLEEVVKYLSEHYKKYAEMKVEIPLSDIKSLLMLDSLGFKEKPHDIPVKKASYTYILTKKIESK